MSGQAAFQHQWRQICLFLLPPFSNHLKEASVSRNHMDHACFSVRFDLIVSYHLYDLGTLYIWVHLPAGGMLADFVTDLIKHV